MASSFSVLRFRTTIDKKAVRFLSFLSKEEAFIAMLHFFKHLRRYSWKTVKLEHKGLPPPFSQLHLFNK